MADQPQPQQVFGPVPTVQAMLVCEKIISEAETNMKTLVNVFDMIKVMRAQQTVQGQAAPQGGTRGFHLYARLYDATGRYVFRVDFVQAESERRIAQAVTEPIDIRDPMSAFDLALMVPMLPLSELGRYEFRLYANDMYLAHVPVRVVEQEHGGQS